MELTCAAEIHIVCLFPTLESAQAFGHAVYEALPPIKNRADIYGNQLYINTEDQVVCTEEKLLVLATQISLDEALPLVESFGGVAILAHIDRHSNGILGILGDIDPSTGYRLAEVSKEAQISDYMPRFPFLSFLSDSDAHNLWTIAEAGDENILEGEFTCAAQVIDKLRSFCL